MSSSSLLGQHTIHPHATLVRAAGYVFCCALCATVQSRGRLRRNVQASLIPAHGTPRTTVAVNPSCSDRRNTHMEQPKYDQKPPMSAAELSPRLLDVEIPTSPPQKEQSPPPPIDRDGDAKDGTEVDEDDVRDERGQDGSLRYMGQPVSPVARPRRK